MKNKGFTLIELLAVIVVLAIIALIATPIILNIISDSEEEANKRSIDLYARAVKNAIASYQLKYAITPGTYTSSSDGKILSMEGIEPLTVEYNGNVYCNTIEIFEDGNIYLANCTVNGKSVEYAYGKSKTLKDNILSNYGGESNITTVTDFNTVTTGLYKAEDDLGTSYYFRGNVDNNYVQFGSYSESDVKYQFMEQPQYSTVEECESAYEEWNFQSGKNKCYKAGGETGDKMYWRIIRINGDGTIRLVYDGVQLYENSNNVKYSSKIPYYSGFSVAEYKDNEMKQTVETWYSKHLSSIYNNYISDSIFCNDTQVSATRYYAMDDNGHFYEVTDPSLAIEYEIDYAAYTRLSSSNPQPILKCIQDIDKYSVNSKNGNGLLTYPIGYITADELYFAGKNNSYLGETFLTMTPQYGGSPAWRTLYMFPDFSIYMGADPVFYVRPVINLKADVKFTGSGTIDDPYVIVTE